MAFEKINQSDYEGKGVTGLPDTPGLTTLAMQQKFDELFKDVALPKFNALVEELKSENACSDIGTPEDVGGMANPSKKLLPLLEQVAATIALLKMASHEHANKSLLDKFNEEMVRAWEAASLVLAGISGTEMEISGNKDKIPTSAAIADYVQQMGGGDMARAMYDKDQSGIVDNAERLGGQLPGYYQPAEDPNLHTVAKTITDAINEVAAKEVDVLDTREEIEANTEPGKVAGALAVRGLYNNLTAGGEIFRYGITADGQRGYIVTGEDGADTVIPFKKGIKYVEQVKIARSNYAYEVDCTSIAGYGNLSADDFICEFVSAYNTNGSTATYTTVITKTYDPATGILALKRNSMPGISANLTVNIYVIG